MSSGNLAMPSGAPPSWTGASQGTSNYFETMRKSELMELQSALQSAQAERRTSKVREGVTKVINYMSAGIDVSPLFTTMLMCIHTKDLVQKKMVYLFLCTSAEQNPDLALLCVNTLVRDCRDESPKIRGLAIRSISSLRLPHLFEYFEPPIAAALEDVAPYVRQAAVFAVAKLQAMCPQQCRQIGFAVRLQSMLYDRDAGVVINVLQALGGLLKAEDPESRGVVLDKALAVHLVNRLPHFNEWGLGFVLSTLERFDWAGEGEELYAVMNAVEPCFQHANSSVVMAAASLFLKFAEKKPQLQGAILKRIRVPLITLSEGGFDELAFVLLSNVELLLQKDPSLFELDYRHFYLRHHDPQYLKEKKLQLLVAVASPRNMHDIVTELSDYVMDTCPAVGVRAIRAIAAIATKIPDAADHATHNLLTILKFDVEHLTAAVLAAFKDLLRFHRHHAARVITSAGPLALTVDDETARGSVVWILGEFGEQLPNAPYLLEVLAEEYDSQKPFVKLQLLTASLKLFFKRPPEVKPWLGALFQSSFNDSLEVNIRDRALLYWRLLTTNVQEAARIINDPKLPIPADGFPENETSELLDYLLEEFNSLSVIFHKPFSRWKPQVQYQAFHDPQESEDDHQHQQFDQPQSQSSDSLPSVVESQTIISTPSSSPIQPIPTSTLHVSTPPVPTPAASIAFALDPAPVMTGGHFESLWEGLSVAGSIELALSAERDLPPASEFERALQEFSIFTMASGVIEHETKIYLYAKDFARDVYALVEMILNTQTRVLKATLKCNDPEWYSGFFLQFQRGLSTL